MNESIIFNITTPDILANATGLQVDLNPFQDILTILFIIAFLIAVNLILTVWHYWRKE